MNIHTGFFDRNDFYGSVTVLDKLISSEIDFVVLAGFLWLVPDNILKRFENRIINIHPALLPKYGGKGMYGEKVHSSVIANHEAESGITIHFVNQHYDEGSIIFQARCKVESSDTADSLAAKIHTLEYEHFPKVIEEIILKLK
jgi:phosphoribosylglycinamide formyltransferase-1